MTRIIKNKIHDLKGFSEAFMMTWDINVALWILLESWTMNTKSSLNSRQQHQIVPPFKTQLAYIIKVRHTIEISTLSNVSTEKATEKRGNISFPVKYTTLILMIIDIFHSAHKLLSTTHGAQFASILPRLCYIGYQFQCLQHLRNYNLLGVGVCSPFEILELSLADSLLSWSTSPF